MDITSYITVITTPSYCNKRISISKTGAINKSSRGAGAVMQAETRPVVDVFAMASLLREIADDECKCLAQGYFPGTEDGAAFQIMSKAAIARVHPGYTGGWVVVNGQRTIARLKADMVPSTWIQLDRDYAEGLPAEWAAMSSDEWLAAVDTFCPGVAKAAHVRVASTSGRVLLDGKPLDASGCRYWLQISDPADYFNLGQRMKMAAAASGYAFRKQMKGNRGAMWSIFDPTVFSWERLVYDGKPKLSREPRLEVGPPDIVEFIGGVLDSHACVLPDQAACDAIKAEYGLTVASASGQLTSVASGYLELGTKVVTEEGRLSVMQFVDSQYDRLRCQATFRESDTWNGILRKVNGVPFLYDNGTHTKYELSDDAKLALSMRPVAGMDGAEAAMGPVLPVGVVRLHRAGLPDVEMGENGPLKPQLATVSNIAWVAKQSGIRLQFNMMTHRTEMVSDDEDDVQQQLGRLNDQLLRLGIKGGMGLWETVETLAREDCYHPMEDWLQEQTWDGHDYIGQLAMTVSTTSPMWDTYLRKWLSQTVAGVMEWRRGGMQLPHVLVFSGPHGCGKSTWFKNLVPNEFFTPEAALHLNGGQGKDDMIRALATSITELAEIDTTFGKSALGSLKSFISNPADKIRAPYGRMAVSRGRMTSFCGTVNVHEFLVDATGNRRFWPVPVTDIKWKHGVDMGQVWGQAFAMHKAGVSFYLTDGEIAEHNLESEAHRASTVMEDLVGRYFTEEVMALDKDKWLAATMTDVCALLGLGATQMLPAAQRSDLSRTLRDVFGISRRLNGKRKAYLVPVKSGDTHLIAKTPGLKSV